MQVASPSRERVEAYMQLRDEIELTVGRINGDFGTMSHQAISYHHHGYPREEMVALYLAADVHARHRPARRHEPRRQGVRRRARFDDDGVLVLSEFAGASDELKRALLHQPARHRRAEGRHPQRHRDAEARPPARMRALRKRVLENDVARWSSDRSSTTLAQATRE